MNPKEYYNQELTKYQLVFDGLIKKTRNLSNIRLLIGIGILAAAYFAFAEAIEGGILALVILIGLFLAVVRRHQALTAEQNKAQNYLEVLSGELDALEGRYSTFKDGSEYIDVKHQYTFDLDFFGERSLYQMVCRAATKAGESRLATLLAEPYATAESIRNKQDTVRELATKLDFLVGFRVAGVDVEEERNGAQKVADWLTMPDFFINNMFLRILVVAVPVVTLALAGAAIFLGMDLSGLAVIVVFNMIVLRWRVAGIREAAHYVAKSAAVISKFEALLREVSNEEFSTGWQERSRAALEEVNKLKKLAHLFESRYNGMVGPLMNAFFLFDIQCAIRLERWRRQGRATLSSALTELTEIDCYVSLATYAFNHPTYTYPTINEEEQVYVGEDVAHPLLQGSATGNDFSLGELERFYLLTGANMTGKSTFIRTVGVNLIFGYLGLPLRAKSVNLPMVRLYTAIRISDSVQDDVSYFKAELNRIKAIMQEVKENDAAYLILLDEPLRGTNTTDKQNGTRSIIQKLMDIGAMGIVATHDTVLCTLEGEHKGKVSNRHFESQIHGNELVFDYKLKTGCSTSNNATILMHQLGIV